MYDWASTGDAGALIQVQRKMEQWRKRRRHCRARIPEDLWQEAADLAREHGVNRIAMALRLDYYSLQRHMKAAAVSGRRAPQFVEILPDAVPTPRPLCTIELEDARGVKMRIGLPGGAVPDLAALARVFREGRS